MTRSFSLIDGRAEATAKAVLAFETEVAAGELADRRSARHRQGLQPYDASRRCRPTRRRSTGGRISTPPGLKGVDSLVVTENTAVQKIAQVFDKTPLETLKAWETFHFVNGASPYLSKRFVDSEFEFDRTALSGTPIQPPRWKRGVSLVDDTSVTRLGKEYVAKYFPPESKAKMDDLVANLQDGDGGAHPWH